MDETAQNAAQNADPAAAQAVDQAAAMLAGHGEKIVGTVQGLIAAATGPGAVFGEPLTVGDRVVITAREVNVGSGFGWGGGYGGPSEPGMGSGGGGGGSGRPVAVITVGPDGVEISPILDRTKVGLAAIAAWSAVAIAFFNVVKVLLGRRR